MPLLNIMTSVSREYNLPRLLHSMESTMEGTGWDIHWIQVFDPPGVLHPYVTLMNEESSKVRITSAVFTGEKSAYAVAQKNFGMDLMEPGFFLCLDDDNVLHPVFLAMMAKAVEANPGKRAFVCAQKRWDHYRHLPALPEKVVPGAIDSAQFMIHTSLIGSDRYDLSKAGCEDGHFVSTIYAKAPDEFAFIEEVASYFNYLRVERSCG